MKPQDSLNPSTLTPYGRPVVVDDELQRTRVLEYADDMPEQWFRDLLDATPSIIPTELVDDRLSAELFSLGAEVATDRGSIDVLAISSDGIPVIIETKLWANHEARRKVVAQILDYAGQLRQWDFQKLDLLARARRKKSLYELVGKGTGLSERVWTDRVARNLRRGRMTLLIVGDGIREEAVDLANQIEAHPDFEFRLAFVALRVTSLDSKSRLVVPHVVAKTVEIGRTLVQVMGGGSVSVTTERANSGAQSNALSESAFLELLGEQRGHRYVEVVQQLRRELAATNAPLGEYWKPKTLSFGLVGDKGLLVEFMGIPAQTDAYVYVPRLREKIGELVEDEREVDKLVDLVRQIYAAHGGRFTAHQFNLDLSKLDGSTSDFARGLAEAAALFPTKLRPTP